MPRTFLRRFLPHPDRFTQRRSLRWLGPIINEAHLFHLNRQAVATAVFIGLFCALLPLPGHMLVAALLAILARCNLVIATLLVVLSNPLTIAPQLVLVYHVGDWLLGREVAEVAFEFSWSWLSQQGFGVIAPIALGSIVCGLVFGGIGYLAVRLLWRWRVANHWHARRRRRQPHS
ncbi:MAG: DUF2062 domain-containing protein [Porticoccaceae bacterium]